MKRKPSRRRSAPPARRPSAALDLAGLVLVRDNLATLAALLEDYQPAGVALVHGQELHRHVGRLLAAEARHLAKLHRRLAEAASCR